MGFRHWVSHIRLDPNSQYLWYTHATFMFLWLHGILCSFPWKPMLKGLKGSSPNPNVFASKQCQACSSRQPWFVSELEASCPNLPWWTVALIFFGPTFPSLNLKDCPNMSKYITKYPYDSCTGLKPLSGHAGFPEHVALKLTYIYMIRNRTVVHSSTTETMRSSLRPKPVVLFIRFVVARRSPENP